MNPYFMITPHSTKKRLLWRCSDESGVKIRASALFLIRDSYINKLCKVKSNSNSILHQWLKIK
jgi:hypothetical protein